MTLHPIATFRSPLSQKFGIPRQSGLAQKLEGRIVFEPDYRRMEAVRGLEDFDYLWLIWEFHANRHDAVSLTVRPPRLGGNQRMGVFATRSPFRPNPLGLSCVRIERIEQHPQLGPVITVSGADLMDGTPIYDLKPYVSYVDAHPEARSGFVDQHAWQPLEVELSEALASPFSPQEREALVELLAQDPRPQYHNDPSRIYGLQFAGRNVRFSVAQGVLKVIECEKISPEQ